MEVPTADELRANPPRHTLLHLSDPHLVDGGDVHGADPEERLRTTLDRIPAHLQAELLVVSGDLTDRGEAAAYRRVHELVAPVAERAGAEILYLAGNHDDRAVLRAELLGGGPLDRVVWSGGLRVIAVDSVVEGEHYGRLGDAQLDWLAATLARPAPHGSILVLHHPPIPSPSPLIQWLMLRDAARLGEVLAGSDVRLVLCGHAHQIATAAVGGIPVFVGPGITLYQDPVARPLHTRNLLGGGYARVDVWDDAAVATFVPVERAELSDAYIIEQLALFGDGV